MEPFLIELKKRILSEYDKQENVFVFPVTEGRKDMALFQINERKQCRIFYYDVTDDRGRCLEYTYTGTKLKVYRDCKADTYDTKNDKDSALSRILLNLIFKKFSSYGYYWIYSDILKIIKVYEGNPRLVSDLNDGGAIKSISELRCIPLDKSGSVKDVFGVSVKYLRASGISQFRGAKWCWEHNFSPAETRKLLEDLGQWEIIDSEYSLRQLKYIANNKIGDIWYYRDYCSMRKFLIEENINVKSFPECPLDTSAAGISKVHDRIMPVYRHTKLLADKKSLQEKTNVYLENYYSKAKAFEYNNSEYSIIACKDLSELEYEGSELHHCVGTYVDSVGHGREYILFLRKNKELDKPFFTVNVLPTNKVKQIHGMGNCNMCDEVIPFVKQWAKKFKLNLENCSGVYCAAR